MPQAALAVGQPRPIGRSGRGGRPYLALVSTWVSTHDQTALPKAVMVAVVSVISTASEPAGWPSSPGMVSVT